jgi:hypothetical protein
MEWRRNQLKQSQNQPEGPNLLQTAGGILAGAGVGTLAFLGARALARGRGVSPVNVQVNEEVVRRAAQPVPQLRGVTQRSGAQTARPPIPRPPTQPIPTAGPPQPAAAPAPAQGRLTGGSVFGYLPSAEEEFVAYRPDPKEMVTREIAEARRQAATEGLLRAAEARRGTYQPELPGVKGTLMALRSNEGVSPEITGELVAQAESRPLSAAPAQQNLFKYVQQAAEPEGDVVDRLLLEYNQLVERQARTDQRVRSSVRDYQMEVQGKALRVMDELRGDSLVQVQQSKRPFNVDQAINALESGEDQSTGRVRQQLQRNEDLDIGAIDRLEDSTNSLDVAASMTPDGIPFDQAEGRLIPGDKGYEDRLLKTIYQQELEARPPALTKEGMERNMRTMINSPRINELVEQGKRYLRGKEVDLGYDYSAENLRQSAQVNDRIARALELKNTAEQIIDEEIGRRGAVDIARGRSADERSRLAAQGFAGERLEQQLLENMRANFPEGREVMQPLQQETGRIERVGMPSQLEVRENIGSVLPLRQGDPERVSKPASQQAGYEGGIRGMGRITREDIEEEGGGMGIYGLERKYASGAVRKRGQFGESDYGEIGYGYSSAAERRPTEITGRTGLEDLRNPYSKLSDEQLGELSMYGSDADKYNAEQQLKKRASFDVSRELRQLQLSNEPGNATNFLTRFKQGLI